MSGVGCENTPLTGLDAVTCTCPPVAPSICDGQAIPSAVQRYSARACRLFAQAVDAPPRRQRRRLRQGARALRRAVAIAVRAQIKGVAPECAAALAEQYGAASDRASSLAEQM